MIETKDKQEHETKELTKILHKNKSCKNKQEQKKTHKT